MRVFLVIAGCLLALVLMMVGAGYWWWQQNGDALVGAVGDGMRDGTEQGKNSTDQECLDASVAKLQRCSDFACGIYNNSFASACLLNAAGEDGLCDSVPRNPGIVESVQWVGAECSNMSVDQSSCQNLMQVVLQHCNGD